MKLGQKQFEAEAVTLTLQASSCCLNTSTLMGSSSSRVPRYCPDQYQGTGRIGETHRHTPLLAAAAPAVEEWSRSMLHAASHTYMHSVTLTHDYICTSPYMHIPPYASAPTPHTHIHTHTHTHMHTHPHTHIHRHTDTDTHTHNTYTHTHPHNAGMIQTHTHTNTYT